MTDDRKRDSLIARMAGNIAAGMVGDHGMRLDAAQTILVAEKAVRLARRILGEIEETDTKDDLPKVCGNCHRTRQPCGCDGA